jgi:hypothetical protein
MSNDEADPCCTKLEEYAEALRLVTPLIANKDQRDLLEDLARDMQRTATKEPAAKTPGTRKKKRKLGEEGR